MVFMELETWNDGYFEGNAQSVCGLSVPDLSKFFFANAATEVQPAVSSEHKSGHDGNEHAWAVAQIFSQLRSRVPSQQLVTCKAPRVSPRQGPTP